MSEHTVNDLYRYLGSCYAQFSKAEEVHTLEKERYNQALAAMVAQNKAISERLEALEKRQNGVETENASGPALVEDTDQDG